MLKIRGGITGFIGGISEIRGGINEIRGGISDLEHLHWTNQITAICCIMA